MPDRKRRYVAVAAAVATVVTAGIVAVGVVGVVEGPGAAPVSPREQPPSVQEVPLSQGTLDGVEARRAPFCDALPAAAVAAAVGKSAKASAYEPGDRFELEPGMTDIAHEFGCRFERGRTVARAWVFAAPVSTGDARAMVRAAVEQKGCSPTGPLGFGTPGAVLDCGAGRRRSLRAIGLFGDTWLHCELSAPAGADLAVRGQRWCAEVAIAVAG
jgi:hypothetical protein